MKRTRIFAIIVAIVLVLSLAACGEEPITSVKYEVVALDEVPTSEFVICVSKAIPDAQQLLDEINKVIRSDAEALTKEYGEVGTKIGTARDLFMENNILRENPDDDPILIYTQVYNPYSYGGAYGAYIDGIDAIICSKVAVNLGRSATFIDRPLSFGYNQVKSGEGDILISAIQKTNELANDFLLSDVYGGGKQCVVALNTLRIKGLKDLSGLTIGVIAGRLSEQVVNDAIKNGTIKNAEVVVFDTDTEAKTALQNQRVFAVVMDELPAKQTATNINKGR